MQDNNIVHQDHEDYSDLTSDDDSDWKMTKNDNNNINNNNELTSEELVLYQDFIKKKTNENTNENTTENTTNMKQCIFCDNMNENDMIVNDADIMQCWHCLFSMNYQINQRQHVDGQYGMTIADYILKYKDSHDIAKCNKISDLCGCFLCEYINGIPITNIKNLEKLYSIQEPNTLNTIKEIKLDDAVVIDVSKYTEYSVKI